MNDVKCIPLPPSPASVRTDLPLLDARLSAAAAWVRGGVVADVGTDHAYLPIALLMQGLCSFAVATDIHEGPALTAAAHLSAYGISSDRAAVLLTDGLCGCESYTPTDVCILGMGGEMIVHIIEKAPWLKSSAIRLILQPMTRMEVLRQYLDQNGFCVVEERLVMADRIYQLLCVQYDGTVRRHTELELLVGEQNLQRADALCLSYLDRQKVVLTASRLGKLRAQAPDTAREDTLLGQIEAYLAAHTDKMNDAGEL